MKKVLIAGPLPKGDKSGGVAVFTDNIAKEFYKQHYDVLVLSAQKLKLFDSIQVLNAFSISAWINIIFKFKPDIVISSLQYSILFSFLPIKSTKIHLLHSFPNFREYSFLKFILMHLYDLIISKTFNYILADSKFTAFINRNILDIKIDGVFHIGISDKEIKSLSGKTVKKNNVSYIGRLVNIKNVKLIFHTFEGLSDNNINFNIIGYGEDADWIDAHSKNYENIHFEGAKKYGDIIKYFKKSKVFISLNPAEPFGITFLEALLTNNFIVAPNTGGQNDLLRQFPDRCRLVDITNSQDISSAIQEGLHKKLPSFYKQYNVKQFSYYRTFLDIKRFIDN